MVLECIAERGVMSYFLSVTLLWLYEKFSAASHSQSLLFTIFPCSISSTPRLYMDAELV